MTKNKSDFTKKSMILSILTGVGVVATGVLAAYCAKKDDDTRPTKQRAINYAPAIVSGTVTIGLVIANAKVSSAEVAALTAACAGLITKLNDYRDAVDEHEVCGEYATDIDKKFARNRAERVLNATPYQHADDIATFIDSYTGMSFEASYEKVLEAEKTLVERYNDDKPVAWCDLLFLATGSRDTYNSNLGPEIGWSKAAMEDIHGTWYGDQTDVTLPPLEITNTKLADGRWKIKYSFMPEWCYYEY
ncbi:MAG: hypothetical protein IJ087_17870 [Eggerthellaceae bacterium]|nr:hypothetical protein [Eggerthellaceae bacterium]